MDWSPQQDRALVKVDEWLRNGDEQVMRVFGYAGTGKTTLAQHFAEGVEGQVLAAAFTGKAAYVLQQKNFPDATTIHSLIYTTSEKSAASLKRAEANLGALLNELSQEGLSQEEIDSHQRVLDLRQLVKHERKSVARPSFSLNHDSVLRDAKLLIVDECSMVDEEMGKDLLRFGTKILVLGDPAQLPPVAGAGFFTENVKPDVMLTEIHRQARDNPIIAMATRVREGDKLLRGTYGESKVIAVEDTRQEEVMESDQLLVGRNKTRATYNARVRSLLGCGGQLPTDGDRLVCLRNNKELGLYNGAIWNVSSLDFTDEQLTRMNVVPEDFPDATPLNVVAHSHHFIGKGEDLPWWERKKAEEFDYGYALTCHKSQGSQWPKVYVRDESRCFRQDAKRWLYTAVTRAADKVIVAN